MSSSRGYRAGRTGLRAEGGYSLVALVVALIVMNIAVAAVMPVWSKLMQREKEEELVFRGLQYAEAIRVFQVRFNRAPTSLEELLEVEPRCIRQLWEDPLSETGAWEPLLVGSGTDITASAPGPEARDGDPFAEPPEGEEITPTGLPTDGLDPSTRSVDTESQVGPIEGVKPTARGPSARTFLGKAEYESWEFRAQMLAPPSVTPEGVPLTPRLDPGALGRAFPSNLQATPGSAPHGDADVGDPFASPPVDEDGGN